MNSSEKHTTSAGKSIDTSLSLEQKQREEFLIQLDLQMTKNKLEYDRSLNAQQKEGLRAFAERRENDLAELMNQ